jgi:hypothetical protein
LSQLQRTAEWVACGRRGTLRSAVSQWPGGPAQRRTGGPICQASHAAPKLGRNIRPVTSKVVVGSLEPDGRLKFLSARR